MGDLGRPACQAAWLRTGTRLLAVKRSEAANTRRQGDHRSLFDRFVQSAYHQVSRAPFFVLCVCIVVAWLVSLPLWEDHKEWQTVIHTVASVLTLLLVALLENAGRRAEEAAQEKLNVIAEALSELMSSESRQDPDLRDAADRLRDAVGLEGRH
jgi:low affinity Fe/Cu permease